MNKANKIYIDRVAMQAYKDFMLYGYDDSPTDLNKRLRKLQLIKDRRNYLQGLDKLISRIDNS